MDIILETVILMGIGLFSVPAPPFRFAASGGVFLLNIRFVVMSDSPWRSTGFAATLQLDGLRAQADFAHPNDGLTNITIAGQGFGHARLLGVAVAAAAGTTDEPVECYVRATDMVVAYDASSRQPLRIDALWRVAARLPSDTFLAAVDLIVSVRTRSLNVQPELPVQSVVPASQTFLLRQLDTAAVAPVTTAPTAITPADGPSCVLFRLSNTDLTYAEMVHPADFQRDEISPTGQEGGTVRIAHRLFRTTLEKGVILRARVRGAFFLRSGDAEAASRCYREFAAAEPPLGT
jgi:hypothetical protein